MPVNASVYDAFVSYNSADAESARALASGLASRGLSVFVDQWYLRPGMSWQDQLERILGSSRAVLVLIGPSGLGSWQKREKSLALDLQSERPDFPVIPVLMDGAADPPLGFLRLNTWVRLTWPLSEETLDRLATTLAGGIAADGVAASERRQQQSSRCPYRGLEVFREEDAELFFGREVFVERLRDAVRRSPFVAVAGASGGGKSSVVRAGLLPRLRRDEQRAWEVAVMRPGSQPFHALASSLLACGGERVSTETILTVGSELRRDPATTLEAVVWRVLEQQPGTHNIALVLDQFEELYTLCRNDGTATSFIAALLGATRVLPFTVVATVRGDFLGRILEMRELADRLEGSLLHLGPMTAAELERSISEPAHRLGVAFETGLIRQLVKDAAAEPGHLPLLEFTLAQLWDRRQGQSIRLADYDSVGGLAGALARHAESAFGRLGPAEHRTARRVLLALVNTGTSEKPTRRRARLAEWGDDPMKVVAALTRERLLVTDRDAADGSEIVEVAHEALFFHWPRFGEWLADDKAFLAWRGRMAFLLEDWVRVGKDEDALLDGYRLGEARDILEARRNDISDDIAHFVRESLARRQRRDEEARQKAEQERERAARDALYRATEQSTQDWAHTFNHALYLASATVERIDDELRSRAEPRLKELIGRLRAVMARMRNTGQMSHVFASLSSGRRIDTVLRGFALDEVVRFVKRLVADMQPAIDPNRSLRFRFDAQLPARGRVRYDSRLLEIAVANVLDNAVTASFADTDIEVRFTIQQDLFVVAIRNQGIPLLAEDVPRVVTRGFRSEQFEAVTGQGSGIGLWMTRAVMHALAGDLEVKPTDPNGITEVRLLLPIASDPK